MKDNSIRLKQLSPEGAILERDGQTIDTEQALAEGFFVPAAHAGRVAKIIGRAMAAARGEIFASADDDDQPTEPTAANPVQDFAEILHTNRVEMNAAESDELNAIYQRQAEAVAAEDQAELKACEIAKSPLLASIAQRMADRIEGQAPYVSEARREDYVACAAWLRQTAEVSFASNEEREQFKAIVGI